MLLPTLNLAVCFIITSSLSSLRGGTNPRRMVNLVGKGRISRTLYKERFAVLQRVSVDSLSTRTRGWGGQEDGAMRTWLWKMWRHSTACWLTGAIPRQWCQRRCSLCIASSSERVDLNMAGPGARLELGVARRIAW